MGADRKSSSPRARNDPRAGRITPIRSGEYALRPAEAKILLARCPNLPDQALLAFAIATGIRREDVVGVALKDVDLERGWVSFWEQKKRRTWTAPLGGEASDILRRHIATLPRGTPWLFPAPNPKNHISGRTAYNKLQRALVHAGLTPRPFHALRATCIKLAQANGWSVPQVMRLTGDTHRTIEEHYATPSLDEMASMAAEKPIV